MEHHEIAVTGEGENGGRGTFRENNAMAEILFEEEAEARAPSG